jgi:hypothetical protein
LFLGGGGGATGCTRTVHPVARTPAPRANPPPPGGDGVHACLFGVSLQVSRHQGTNMMGVRGVWVGGGGDECLFIRRQLMGAEFERALSESLIPTRSDPSPL